MVMTTVRPFLEWYGVSTDFSDVLIYDASVLKVVLVPVVAMLHLWVSGMVVVDTKSNPPKHEQNKNSHRGSFCFVEERNLCLLLLCDLLLCDLLCRLFLCCHSGGELVAYKICFDLKASSGDASVLEKLFSYSAMNTPVTIIPLN